MYRPVAGKPGLGVGLLMLLILVLSACGEEAHARKIPESSGGRSMKSIPAGMYVSDEYRPAMSFSLNEDWQTGPAVDRKTVRKVSDVPAKPPKRCYSDRFGPASPTRGHKEMGILELHG